MDRKKNKHLAKISSEKIIADITIDDQTFTFKQLLIYMCSQSVTELRNCCVNILK